MWVLFVLYRPTCNFVCLGILKIILFFAEIDLNASIYIALFFLSSPPDSIHYAKTLERIECEERLDYAYAQNIYDDRTETHFTGL